MLPLVKVVSVTETRNHSEEAPPLSVTSCGSVQGLENLGASCLSLVKCIEYGLFACRIAALVLHGTVLSGFLVLRLSLRSWEDLLLKWANTIFILPVAWLPLKL